MPRNPKPENETLRLAQLLGTHQSDAVVKRTHYTITCKSRPIVTMYPNEALSELDKAVLAELTRGWLANKRSVNQMLDSLDSWFAEKDKPDQPDDPIIVIATPIQGGD